jgi:hypothetical protein
MGWFSFTSLAIMENLKYYYVNPHTLLVVNPKGQIRILYTPFRVKCITPLPGIRTNSWVYVEKVGSTPKDELLYTINNESYPHKFFRLVINF